MRTRALICVSAVAALVATSASAAPQKISFSGQIINDATQAATTYVATYTYDVSQGTVTTSSEAGGLVTTSYSGPLQAIIAFGGQSYTIDDTDPSTPGAVVLSDETQLQPPSITYIADANSTTGSITNLIQVQGGKVTDQFGVYEQFSNGDLVGDYTLVPSSVSAAPEPSTWALMMLALGGAGLALRRAGRGEASLAATVAG